MVARTIRSGIGTYQDVDGQWRHGVLGDEVDVHKDDVDRFDRLNPEAPEPETETEPAAADTADEPSFSQEDVDAAVKAAVESKDAELAAAAKALDEKAQEVAAAVKELETVKAELESVKAAAAKASAKK